MVAPLRPRRGPGILAPHVRNPAAARALNTGLGGVIDLHDG
jgi:hypothetical protein